MRSTRPPDEDFLARQEAFDFGPPRPVVRNARPGERRTVLEVLGRAFYDDPVAQHLFPSDETRAAKWAAFSGLAIDSMAESAEVLTNDATEGVAIWQLPREAGSGFLRRLEIGTRFLRLAGTGLLRSHALSRLTSAHRPREPHYYLAALGTDPKMQGRGIGSALLAPILERCEKERLPAYLESSKERNVPFYQKHGFEVIEALDVPSGPRIFTMMRHSC